jgi:hypothetical protein
MHAPLASNLVYSLVSLFIIVALKSLQKRIIHQLGGNQIEKLCLSAGESQEISQIDL